MVWGISGTLQWTVVAAVTLQCLAWFIAAASAPIEAEIWPQSQGHLVVSCPAVGQSYSMQELLRRWKGLTWGRWCRSSTPPSSGSGGVQPVEKASLACSLQGIYCFSARSCRSWTVGSCWPDRGALLQIFHSIFIGIDLGIQHDPSTARALMIALMFHQVH